MDLTAPRWRKSRHSGTESNCVEVAFVWPNGSGVADEDGRAEDAVPKWDQVDAPCQMAPPFVVIRDSKVPDGPWLFFVSAEWDAFRTGLRAGELGERSYAGA
ncbi:DUF397 domain-containing protein [Sphaerisporangium corydalis]|uniref:DUF397 domain-containing protein n=1 Tax=Sphaerisporangium corydalis TaxID=1441875 RepID=A0ABV9E8E0_9ACTN|nr:DUF397 domain-containing protein [Sphaerisporangium corydalis]